MGYWLEEARHRHEQVAVDIPALWITIALSLLIHGAALFLWLPHTRILAPWTPDEDQESDRLQVRLTPAPPPPPAGAPEPPREIIAIAKPRPQRPTSQPRPPPVLTVPAAAAPARPAPVPTAPPTPASLAPAPQQASLPTAGDLMAYVEARRRERGELPAPPVDSQTQASIAANLPTAATGVAAQDKRRGGGIFEIKRMDYDDAAFEFFGWNAEMGRKTPQLIEVRKGDSSSMEIAVVRRMIAIIREYSKEDFIWRSPRQGQDLVLSARPSDNAELERFMLHEFFDDPRQTH